MIKMKKEARWSINLEIWFQLLRDSDMFFTCQFLRALHHPGEPAPPKDEVVKEHVFIKIYWRTLF